MPGYETAKIAVASKSPKPDKSREAVRRNKNTLAIEQRNGKSRSTSSEKPKSRTAPRSIHKNKIGAT